jgi:hypothetical protein
LRSPRCIWPALALAWAVVPSPAAAQPSGRRVNLIRIEGHKGQPSPAAHSLATWGLNDRGQVHRFLVLQVRVLQGELSAAKIITAMQPYAFETQQVTFFLRGPRDLLVQFAETPPDQPIALIAYVRLPERQLSLSDIEVLAVPTSTLEKRGTPVTQPLGRGDD